MSKGDIRRDVCGIHCCIGNVWVKTTVSQENRSLLRLCQKIESYINCDIVQNEILAEYYYLSKQQTYL